MYKHAVICTKAYPLHKGHEYLVNEARRLSEHTTLIIVWSHDQNPSGDVRSGWAWQVWSDALDVTIKNVVDIHVDDTKPEESKLWGQYTRDIMNGVDFDVVFTSEPYGEWWAQSMGVKHHKVDGLRTMVPISGTEIRGDPYLNWSYISDPAKDWYRKRVLVVGAESTGKSTLCKNLSQMYNTRFVPEYGRIYVEQHGGLEGTDYRVIFAEIVNRQPELERVIENQSNFVCFYDTDLYTTSIWYELWQKDRIGDALHENIKLAARSNDHYDLVLVCDHEGVPWVDDGLRDQPDTRALFTQRLTNNWYFDSRTILLKGDWEQRTSRAVQEVNKLFEDSDVTLP